MSVKIKYKKVGKNKAGKRKRARTHVQAQQPLVPAGQRGWWRLTHLLGYYGGMSATEYYKGAKLGKYPKPDKYVGRIPFWNAENF